MKAIKIASGVAITALALAISAQANAAAHEGGNTEFSMSATGSMEAMFLMDLENSSNDVELDDGDDFDSKTAGEAWGLQFDIDVTHGPFAGTVRSEVDDGTLTYEIVDLIVTDGPISFGQIGSVLTTDDYTWDMGDSTTNVGSTDLELDDGAPIGAGLRYTAGDLKVQVDGQNGGETFGSDYGVSAAYAGSADAISYVVDAQFRGSDDAPSKADAYTYVGAGVTYAADIATIAVGFNTYTTPTTAAQVTSGEKETFSEYGFTLTATPVDALSAYVKGQDLDAGNSTESMVLLAGAAYTVDMLTFTGEYTYTALNEDTAAADLPTVGASDISNGANWDDYFDNVFLEVAYSDGPVSAYADATFFIEAGDAFEDYGPKFGVGAAYTQENGVKYAADYDFQDYEDITGATGAVTNTMKFSAAYAF